MRRCRSINLIALNKFLRYTKMLPVYNPPTPYVGKIGPGGFNHGSQIRIKGQMTYGFSKRFKINLQLTSSIEPLLTNIALHLSVRPTEQTIVRNHFVAHQWGQEERYGSCPIDVGNFFEITIRAESNCYNISVNNMHLCTFNHRLPLNQAQYIWIDGDVQVQSITLENGWNSGGITTLPIIVGGIGNPISICPPVHHGPTYPGFVPPHYARPGHPGAIHAPIHIGPAYPHGHHGGPPHHGGHSHHGHGSPFGHHR